MTKLTFCGIMMPLIKIAEKGTLMRKFSSYGPVDTDLHYYVPRQALIDRAVYHLVGEDPTKGGHYITVWGPRQRGKSWIMQQAMWQLQNSPAGLPFDVLMINLVYLKMAPDSVGVAQLITNELCEKLGLPPITIQHLSDFYAVFKCDVLRNPLILILDEFDSLAPQTINGLISVFRNIYNTRRDQSGTSTKMDYLLHGMALIGVYGA